MKKSRDYMIVETGFDGKKYLVIKGKLIDKNLEGFSLNDDFNENLVNDKNKPYSILKVYEPVKLGFSFELDIEKIVKEQNPKVIWERKPTPVSKAVLSRMNKSEVQKYIMNLVYPCVIVK